jgi:transglutaminase-like putative cysteine protease
MLAAASVGLAAIAVDLIAVRLRRPALAGLPLLVVYLAPVATYANVTGLASAVAFALAAAGYLALLSADGRNRLRRWGKLVSVWHTTEADAKLRGSDVAALAATGRRIGLAAVCAAVIAPLLLPSLNLHRLFGNGHGAGGSQFVQVALPDPVAQLRTLLARTTPLPVLSYRAYGTGQGNDYLQIYALNYNPARSRWDLIEPGNDSLPTSGGALLQPPGLGVATPTISTKLVVTFSAHVSGYSSPIFFLPVPYWPQSLQASSGSWQESRGTLMLYSGNINPAGLHYTVISAQAAPTQAQLTAPQQLPAEIRRDFLGFPSPVTGQLTTIAQAVTRHQRTAFAKAVALEHWFQSGQFGYTLASDLPNTPGGLLDFLTSVKHGNCQQFAFAMAVLARLIHIPSRIAIGYTPGSLQPDGSWLVTTGDAHAWPELYFAGIGWLRFEPTPGGSHGQGTAVQPTYATGPVILPSTGPTNPATGRPFPGQGKGHPGIKPGVTGLGGNGSGQSRGGSSPIDATDALLIALGVLAALGAAPAAARLLSRRRRWRVATGAAAHAEAAWLEIRDDLDDFGQPCRDSDSPRAVARQVRAVADGDQTAADAIGRITAVIERTRYAPVLPPTESLRDDVRIVRRALARGTTVRTRWRARLLPASTLRPVRAMFRQSVGIVTGWMPTPADEPTG